MFTWTEESIQWYREAAEYTKYAQIIGEKVSPFIDSSDTVCDLGCGLGYISLELAKVSRHVTAIDIEEKALQVLADHAKLQQINNLEIIQKDFADLSYEPKWDVMFLSFFKQKDEEIIRLLQMARKRVIAVVSNGNKKGFWPEETAKHKKGKADVLIKILADKNLLTEHIRFQLDFGQPLYSLGEARKFIGHYSPQCTTEAIREHIRQSIEQMQPDSHGNTYYLPNLKEVSIVIIDKEKLSEL